MDVLRLAILSDIHYAGSAERARGADYMTRHIENPLRRLAVQLYRYFVWQRDPFGHNHLLEEFIRRAAGADLVLALGDYSCDSGFVGLSDEASFQSAAECLEKLRTHFGARLAAIIGDHELGKKPLGSDRGGLRVGSFHRAVNELKLEPFWQRDFGRYRLIGVTSTLLALPVMEAEALPEEWPEWQRLREEHLAAVRAAFESLRPDQRVLLACHDPTALPFLWELACVREKAGQIERTLIGHLHTRWVLRQSRLLSGMPPIRFLGHTPRRLSSALRRAKLWRPFRLLLCPGLAGIELAKDGGYLTGELTLDGSKPAAFELHVWKKLGIRP